jgi:SAM-dependent methyltransferase
MAELGSAESEVRMEWYQSDDFWTTYWDGMFADARREQVRRVVQTSPILDLHVESDILDLCCGPGLYTAPLLARGHRVTGVDLSPAMLERAADACAAWADRVSLVHADMLDYVEPNTFDLALNTFTSFGYLPDPEQNLSVLRNVWHSLKPGGRLVLELISKETVGPLLNEPLVVEDIVKEHSLLDGGNRLRMVWKLPRKEIETAIDFQLYGVDELDAMLYDSGFSTVTHFGDWDASEFHGGSPHLVAVASR